MLKARRIVAEPKPQDEQHQDQPDDKTPYERIEELAKKLFRVPKEEADEERRKDEREKKRTR
jgi:hypothetical protein